MEREKKDDMPGISPNEFKVLKFISEHPSRDGGLRESEIVINGMSKVQIASSVSWLETKNLITTKKLEETDYSLGDEAVGYQEKGLPEEQVYNFCLANGVVSIDELMKQFGENITKIALTQLSKYGIKPINRKVTIERDQQMEADFKNRREFLKSLQSGGSATDNDMLEHFKKRKGSLVDRKRTLREIHLTEQGVQALSGYEENDLIEEITSEIISSGEWREKGFRAYDLTSQVEPRSGGFLHPLSLLISEVKKIFIGMGFSEMPGHYIEYAGWNMDALFIPQDHPARDMQDTFFLKSKKKPEFERPEILAVLKKVHEEGIKGYSGWGYEWSHEKAMDLLLRTHTTVSTIRYLYEHPDSPKAVFSVDKVFRHESVDWKHLAELNQIEGAYYGKDASLSKLKWLMTEFYGRLGFEKLKFIPSYYPYTEPSMDVVAYLDGKEVELGGSGVFRPEVTEPLGLKGRVLAWGLGLERLAMLYYGLDDVRKIYQSDIEWLRTFHVVSH